ncbi:hypothetical protein H257_14809 [Aphanomyces astaci]|uniref:Uncharacterized protein n=1 Tax=Aphanomyces astaci TaxID=112090 RepID=W4FRG3_APHAT|nr:hypothetical protein H257_14809 [Aphanomyces astaci]ETV69424.1 hypothetical protein H257_14809 [Aphanomyces astaci]|eukprot:XP_009840997.1 hypothetical protein H257_14809 [Aphanomyces astaci]
MENQPQRTSREHTGRDKARLIQLLRPFLKNDKLQRVSYNWRKFRDTESTTSNEVGKVGPKPTYSKQLVQQLVEDVHVDPRSTLRDVAAGSGLTMGTLSRHLKNGTLNASHYNLWDVVHLDEKWFNADKDRRKVYLVPGEKPPRCAWNTKRFVPKVMFLAAVARPRYDEVRGVFFNGKVVMWPFVRLVIPAIKASLPSANKRVVLQHDNATPHGAITDSALAAVSTDGWTFVMRRQPPNSPDLNVLDLGFFASIQSLQYKKMSRSVDDVVRHTM